MSGGGRFEHFRHCEPEVTVSRFALTTVVALTLIGCFESGLGPTRVVTTLDPPPTQAVSHAPDPPPGPPVPAPPPARPPELTFVWVIVLDDVSGVCIPGARVEIVRGQGLGRSLTQSLLAKACDWWEPNNDVYFRDLNVGEELTLRASAPGFAAWDKTVVPTPGGQFAVPFVLSRIQ